MKLKITNIGYVPIGVYDEEGILHVLQPSESKIIFGDIKPTSSLAVEPVEEVDSILIEKKRKKRGEE